MQWNDTSECRIHARAFRGCRFRLRTRRTTLSPKRTDPNSVLSFYKTLLTLRHTNKALLDGDYVALNENDPNVYTYLRRYKDQAVLVVLNMSDSPQKVSLDRRRRDSMRSRQRHWWPPIRREPRSR